MSPPALHATFPGVVYQLRNVNFLPLIISQPYIWWHLLLWHKLKLVHLHLSSYIPPSLNILTSLVGGQNLKTMIIKNGMPTVVPNYAKVHTVIQKPLSPIEIPVLGARYLHWCCHCICHPHHHCQTWVCWIPPFFSLSLTNINRKHSLHFEQHKAAFEQGAAEDNIPEQDPASVPEKDFASQAPDEKGSIHQIEWCNDDMECKYTLLKMRIFSIFRYKPYSTLNKIAMITKIGQAQSTWLKYYSEKCAVLVVEIAVSSQARPLQYAWNLLQRQYYHEIVH